MTPLIYFEELWQRCEMFPAIHGFIVNQTTLPPDELLRAEWAARVSALDLYVHELVAVNMVRIFIGQRPTCPGFGQFQVSGEALLRLQDPTADRAPIFDLEVRTRLSRMTYQYPDSIADGVRMISSCSLWNEVAQKLGATPAGAAERAKSIKRDLSLIIERRNKIVHEGDLQPGIPRMPWSIARSQVNFVACFVYDIVQAIDEIV